ncbi:cell division protein DivIVA [Corynebacterium striatum]|uniref:cell division protein DivIVA n=1 Tax=Corynebacterium striatum TaxID=43770 RepID=UPI00209C11A3|nr:cell division protein DivIVA [Corynebacterium striatum]
MLSWILLIAVLLALVILGTWVWGSIFGRGEVFSDLDEHRDLVKDNREALREDRFDDIRFDVVSYGYRQTQVDALLNELEKRLTSTGSNSEASTGETAAATEESAESGKSMASADKDAPAVAQARGANLKDLKDTEG